MRTAWKPWAYDTRTITIHKVTTKIYWYIELKSSWCPTKTAQSFWPLWNNWSLPLSYPDSALYFTRRIILYFRWKPTLPVALHSGSFLATTGIQPNWVPAVCHSAKEIGLFPDFSIRSRMCQPSTRARLRFYKRWFSMTGYFQPCNDGVAVEVWDGRKKLSTHLPLYRRGSSRNLTNFYVVPNVCAIDYLSNYIVLYTHPFRK